MVDNYIHLINGKEVPFTAEEIVARKAEEAEANNDASKLESIKQIRLQKLIETDWMSASDYTMPSYIKTWRQTLRDIPANHTDGDAYDLLLARNSDGELTHSVWTQPTS
tara:strand:+ start:844 stop:1170 length:327 start_codon:yes stop_codon:yes gene_type:complete